MSTAAHRADRRGRRREAVAVADLHLLALILPAAVPVGGRARQGGVLIAVGDAGSPARRGKETKETCKYYMYGRFTVAKSMKRDG